jgi:hypothetical protein
MVSFYGYSEVKTIKDIIRPNVLNLNLEFRENYQLPLLDPKKPLLLTYILFDRNADQDSYNNHDTDYSVWPDPLYQQQIKNLVNALASCAEGEKNPVVVQIRGFASSNQWESASGEALDDIMETVDDVENYGEAFNFYIANKRAENVTTLVKKEIGNRKSFQIQNFRWKKYKEMTDEMSFEDIDSASYLETRGFIARRVEIRILEAPGCVNRKYE